MNIIVPIVSFSVLLPNGLSIACEDLHSAKLLCVYLNEQNNSAANEPIISYTVTLPNGLCMPCKDLHSAEVLCVYLNELEEDTEPKKDNNDEHYNLLVGRLVGQMPSGSTITRNNIGGWKYRDKNGLEYGPYVNVLKALDILRKP